MVLYVVSPAAGATIGDSDIACAEASVLEQLAMLVGRDSTAALR